MTARPRSRAARGRRPLRRLAEPPPRLASRIAAQPGARFLPLLLVFFVGSGCAALVYEVVWFQVLELVIGSSAISIAAVLATYMGGMCIGSVALARFVRADRHPLRVYAFIELAVGLCGLVALWLVPLGGGLYLAISGPGIGGLLLRGLLGAICILPPTVLMGATLPSVSRWIEATPRGMSWLGFLYAGNTLGAVMGCLLAGFYLLRVHNVFFATYVAVAINLVIGCGSLWLSRKTVYVAAAGECAPATGRPSPEAWPVLLSIGLSGMTALSAEVVWTRLLSLHLGATVYAFSLILAAILLGVGIGSYLGSLMTRLPINPRTLLGLCQTLLTAGIAWSAYLLAVVLPYSPNDAALSHSAIVAFQHDLMRSLRTVMPAALLWGASFPLALAAVARHDADPGRSVGLVYAANTVGAIVGALGTSLIAMASLGSQRIQQGLICVAALSAVLALVPSGVDRKRTLRATMPTAGFVLVPLLLAAVFAGVVRPVAGNLVGYGPGSVLWPPDDVTFIYVGEGMNSSVAVSRRANGQLNYHNAGKIQASTEPKDLRLERMLGHLTTLQPTHPESVLVIGCGAGVTAGAVSVDPRVQRLTVVEIEPLVPKAAQTYFAGVNEGVLSNPKTNVVIDDGRHYLMTSRARYDAITCDPFDPWTKGAAALSTREFFESVKEHLNPGGVVTVWVPLYQTSPEAVKSQIATFMSVFPSGVVWGNTAYGFGYDIVLSGGVDYLPIDLDERDARVMGPEYNRVRESLASVGFASVRDLFSTFAVTGPDIVPWLAGVELNLDQNLRLQYLAGMGLGHTDSNAIYQDLISDRQWPQWLFTGTPRSLEALRNAVSGM